ncbi:hypothetical protein [Nocardioides dongkuii]|uniref:hypothetical protein n=1 Tax=Nocardioides dongkuii TaxID=2760089 RepID=UPI0015FA471B|nr:hypothetical protein [Nocardioides dongkuii]
MTGGGGARRAAHALAATVLAATGLAYVAPPLASAATSQPPPEPVRVLLVGDSVTQGSAGDWTWRYRLWQHLESVGAGVDLVGPRTDLYDNVADQHGSTAYADPGFDRDHAARWGMLLREPDVPLGELVETYRPDVVVEARGLNDFVWVGASAPETLDLVEDEVAEARAVDPDVDVVLTRLPQTWYDESAGGAITAYNAGLGDLAADLDTPQSRVVATATGSGFVQGEDTWDPAHLSAQGEVTMAAAVADALAAVEVGAPYPRPLPVVRNGHWTPASLSATAGDGVARLRWTSGPGVAREWVWVRDLTARREWTRLSAPVPGPAWTAGGLVDGHTYAFRLQGLKGSIAADRYSNTVRMAPVPPVPEAPARLRAALGKRSVRLSWGPARHATSYAVWHRERAGWRRVAGTGRHAVTLPRPGRGVHRWRVRAWHDRVAGPWSRTVRVRVR